ncbi:MAG: anti-sigma regulatory factor [Bacilli bacterium]|nr:anti-sigma regulatory factor [Bacilli bacterium]
MTVSFEFAVYHEDYHNAGVASSEIKKYLTQIGLDPQLIRRIVICSYEAEMNVVIHSYGGKMVLLIDDNEIRLEIADKGPGIPNIELAMQEGYSTAPLSARERGFGAGMGLPNMKKNADVFEIASSPQGTVVKLAWVII